jgi:hypothetical protein
MDELSVLKLAAAVQYWRMEMVQMLMLIGI